MEEGKAKGEEGGIGKGVRRFGERERINDEGSIS